MLVFLKSHFELVVCLVRRNARNRLAMLSDSESELFITQSSFSGSTSFELSENNFESLFAGADNEKAVDNFNLRTEDLLTDLFTDIEDSGRGITTVSDKEIQAKNEARIPQNTKRATSWSERRAEGNCDRCFARISD